MRRRTVLREIDIDVGLAAESADQVTGVQAAFLLLRLLDLLRRHSDLSHL